MKVDTFDQFHLLKLSELATLESNPTIIRLKTDDDSVIYHVEIKSFMEKDRKVYLGVIFLNGKQIRSSGNVVKLSYVKKYLLGELRKGINRDLY